MGVLALQNKYRHLQGLLNRPWDSLRTWKTELPVAARTPLPYELFRAMFVECFAWAHRDESE